MLEGKHQEWTKAVPYVRRLPPSAWGGPLLRSTLLSFCHLCLLQAFLDTILVLAIVMGSGTMLLGVNILLANGSEWWYHRG